MTGLMRRLLTRLTPPWLDDQAANAKAGVLDARELLEAVAEREPLVNDLINRHYKDRARNHYGERVARALGGRVTWN